MAKCIRRQDGVVTRVTNEVAQRLVEKKLATYVSKKEWRNSRGPMA